MKKSIYILVCSLVLIIFTSCTRENYLDFQPKGVEVPSQIKDYRLLLDKSQERGSEFSSGFGTKHFINVFMNDGVRIDDSVVLAIPLAPSERRAALFEEFLYDFNAEDEDWKGYYNQIYNANVILEGLKTVTDGSEAEKNELRSEALLHRAYAYFNLVNLYGLHYNPATADTDLGVPIREGISFDNLDFTRPSVGENYDLIVADILESVGSLKDASPLEFGFRPSKAAAYGLLAKVYVYRAEYDKALDAIEKALSLKSQLRDINTDSSNFFENLLSMPNPLDDVQLVWFKLSSFDIVPTDEFFELYDENDLRKRWWLPIQEFYSSDLDVSLYAAGFENRNSNAGLSTPDFYLIRAECNARLGNTTAANADLNELRKNRFAEDTFSPINITNNVALLQFVKEERRRELPTLMERSFDIKRYNLFDGDNISITRTLNGKAVTLPANSKNWALPIGQKYINRNPEIEQNPRD